MAWCTGFSQERRCRSDKDLTVRQAFESERSRLLRLPDDRYPSHTLMTAKTGKTNFIRFDRNDYSVPGAYVRKLITIQATTDSVSIVHGDKEIARHKRSWGSGEEVSDERHHAEILEVKRRAKSSRTAETLLGLIPGARRFLERIAEQGGNLGSTVQGIHKCLGEYGLELVTAGITAALECPKVSVATVRIKVEKIRAEEGKPIPLSLTAQAEEKTSHIFVSPANLARYDVLGEVADE
jgi:hypothetical protein